MVKNGQKFDKNGQNFDKNGQKWSKIEKKFFETTCVMFKNLRLDFFDFNNR